jgi:predicted phosphodiesterase
MRYAFISDIHANLTALQMVLNDIAKRHIDKIICLGDTVGYGPQPVETLELVYQVTEYHLLGNHDAAVCGKLNPLVFCPEARKVVLKHRGMLSNKALIWLKSLPLTLESPAFRCVHGDFTKPGAFRYIITGEDAQPSFENTFEQLMFVGHTHLAAIYVIGQSGTAHFLEPRDFILEDHKRYIINPGTIGYPRTGRLESTYCVFDHSERSIVFHHLPFDRIAFNNTLLLAGMDAVPWLREHTAESSLPAVREKLSFVKPIDEEHHLTETIRRLQHTQRSQIKKYRLLIFLIAVLSLCASIYLICKVRHSNSSTGYALTLPKERMPMIQPRGDGLATDNYLHALPSVINRNNEMRGWRYTLNDRRTQQLESGKTSDSIIISHRSRARFVLESPLIRIGECGLGHLRMQGRIRKLDNYHGIVSYQVQSYGIDAEDTLSNKKLDSIEVRGRTNEGQNIAAISRKIRVNRGTTHVRFRIVADFSGKVELRQPILRGYNDSIPATPDEEGNIP